jgi:hypothetical protein
LLPPHLRLLLPLRPLLQVLLVVIMCLLFTNRMVTLRMMMMTMMRNHFHLLEDLGGSVEMAPRPRTNPPSWTIQLIIHGLALATPPMLADWDRTIINMRDKLRMYQTMKQCWRTHLLTTATAHHHLSQVLVLWMINMLVDM